MQYILSEKEYFELKSRADIEKSASKTKINKICQEIATTLPVYFWGRTEPSIWGCIYEDEDSVRSTEYCDECPMEKYCTMPKEFSQ